MVPDASITACKVPDTSLLIIQIITKRGAVNLADILISQYISPDRVLIRIRMCSGYTHHKCDWIATSTTQSTIFYSYRKRIIFTALFTMKIIRSKHFTKQPSSCRFEYTYNSNHFILFDISHVSKKSIAAIYACSTGITKSLDISVSSFSEPILKITYSSSNPLLSVYA